MTHYLTNLEKEMAVRLALSRQAFDLRMAEERRRHAEDIERQKDAVVSEDYVSRKYRK